MKTIVLASKSPRRKALMRQLGLKFTVVPSWVDEGLNPRLKPKGQAEALSLQKAESVRVMLEKKTKGVNYIIVSADTLVALDDDAMGKPKDERDAKRMLRRLSGKRHSVITGFTVIDMELKKKVTKSVETFVYFRNLGEKEIKEYVEEEKLSDKAGAYAIQGKAAVFVEKIEGDYFNIVGLPLHALAVELKRFGVEVWDRG